MSAAAVRPRAHRADELITGNSADVQVGDEGQGAPPLIGAVVQHDRAGVRRLIAPDSEPRTFPRLGAARTGARSLRSSDPPPLPAPSFPVSRYGRYTPGETVMKADQGKRRIDRC